MQTDPSIYEFLATGAEAFRVLSDGVTLSGAYRFVSLTHKGIERRMDGVYEPEGHAGPVYVVEFQAQSVAGVWYNLLTKLGLYDERGVADHVARTSTPAADPCLSGDLCRG